jgi:CheY-like chemotaxis protein
MGNIQATEFQRETRQLMDSISLSLANLKSENGEKKLLYKHYLYWNEIKSLATLFSLQDIATLAHEIQYLFDLVTKEQLDLAQIGTNCFSESLEYINASLDNCINNKAHELNLAALLKKIHQHSALAIRKVPAPTTSGSPTKQSQPYIPKILLIEDEPVNMALLEANIKHVNSNVEIILAESAEEGLYHFFTNKFDLIFLDIMMPVIDGNDFIAIVEKNIAKKNIPNRTNIVVQTALQSIAQLTTLAKKECVQEIIRKPISLTRIEECIERYCIAHTDH